MTMVHPEEHLPRSAAELDQLADYYETHDTSADMESGEWVEPGPTVVPAITQG